MRYALSVLFLGIVGALILAFPSPGKNAGNEAKVIFIVR